MAEAELFEDDIGQTPDEEDLTNIHLDTTNDPSKEFEHQDAFCVKSLDIVSITAKCGDSCAGSCSSSSAASFSSSANNIRQRSICRKKRISKSRQQHQDTASFPPDEILLLLESKERDLQLAAKFGNSLLEENRELRERNEYLEGSLDASNETISQLKNQLSKRSSLFRVMCDLDEEDDEGGSSTANSARDAVNLECQLKQLSSINESLEQKALRLETRLTLLQRQEEENTTEHFFQLRDTNLKMERLQAQVAEKSQECTKQAEEVRKLRGELSRRKSHEDLLWMENETLISRLEKVTVEKQQLVAEMSALQERHSEALFALKETEQELKSRAFPASKRASSADSLFDSLQSELEPFDFGCFAAGAPMCSSRIRRGDYAFLSPPNEAVAVKRQADESCSPNCLNENNFNINPSAQTHEPRIRIILGDDSSVKGEEDNDRIDDEEVFAGGVIDSFEMPSKEMLRAMSSSSCRSNPPNEQQHIFATFCSQQLQNVAFVEREFTTKQESTVTAASLFAAPYADLMKPSSPKHNRCKSDEPKLCVKKQQQPETEFKIYNQKISPDAEIFIQRERRLPTQLALKPKLLPIKIRGLEALTEDDQKPFSQRSSVLRTQQSVSETTKFPRISLTNTTSALPNLSTSTTASNCEDDGDFYGLKLGEPGRPGTRDLQISLGRLQHDEE